MKNGNLRLVILILVMALAYLVNKNNQALSDRYFLWRNPPSPEAVEIADKTGMSSLSRRIFFVSRPSIDNAEELNAHCSDIETTMIILGCYARGQIHIFDVRDERIADAKYVTSAHEMLHAAYVRLSKDERNRVNALLDEAYQYVSENDELRDIMDEYSRVEPEQRYNELHSILGAEHADLSPELEKYYARYFTDRRKTVGMAVQYRKVFKNLETEQARLQVQLDRLAANIEAATSVLDSGIFFLNRNIETFTAKKFRSRSEFNAERKALVEREKDLMEFRAQIEADIRQYDKLVKEYNNLGGKLAQLNYQLDSKTQAGVRAIKDADAHQGSAE